MTNYRRIVEGDTIHRFAKPCEESDHIKDKYFYRRQESNPNPRSVGNQHTSDYPTMAVTFEKLIL